MRMSGCIVRVCSYGLSKLQCFLAILTILFKPGPLMWTGRIPSNSSFGPHACRDKLPHRNCGILNSRDSIHAGSVHKQKKIKKYSMYTECSLRQDLGAYESLLHDCVSPIHYPALTPTKLKHTSLAVLQLAISHTCLIHEPLCFVHLNSTGITYLVVLSNARD